MFGIAFAGGAEIFAAFIVLMLVAFIQSTYSRSGSSGIDRHPYFRRTTDCPGARSQRVSGRDGIASMTSRGTR